MKSPFKLWQHLHGSWTCYKSVISLISNKECASKRNVVNPVLCAVLTQRVFFGKTATLRHQSSSETQGESVGSEKKARRKFSSRPVLENYQWDLFENSFVDFISILVILRTSTNGHFLTTANSVRRPFLWRTVYTFTLVSTSLQWPLASNPEVAVLERINFWQLSPEGEVITGGKHRDVKHRGILCTDPIWGNSCFSNYQVSWIKKDSNLCK